MDINKRDKKPEPSRIPGVDPDAVGQQQFWPGDGLQVPGEMTDEVNGKKEKTILPELPNHPTSDLQ